MSMSMKAALWPQKNKRENVQQQSLLPDMAPQPYWPPLPDGNTGTLGHLLNSDDKSHCGTNNTFPGSVFQQWGSRMRSWYSAPGQGFSTSALLTFWQDKFLLLGDSNVIYRMFSSSSGLHPPDARSTFSPFKDVKGNVCRYCQLPRRGQNYLWLRATVLDTCTHTLLNACFSHCQN